MKMEYEKITEVGQFRKQELTGFFCFICYGAGNADGALQMVSGSDGDRIKNKQEIRW